MAQRDRVKEDYEVTFVPFIDGALAVVNMTALGKNMSVTTHWQGNSGVLPADYTTLAQQVSSRWRVDIMPLLSISANFVDVTVYDLNSEASPVYINVTGTGAPGTRTGDIAPLNCAMITTLRTNLRGRSFRGRMYIPALGELDINGDEWDAGAVTAMQAAVDNFQLSVENTSAFILAVASRVFEGAPRTLGVMTPVSSLLVRSYVGTRRKRL